MSYVYFIKAENTNNVKIGVANDVENRLLSLQTSSPFKLKLKVKIKSESPTLLERTIHYNLRDKQMQGEWFDLDNKTLEIIINKASNGKLKSIGEHLDSLIEWFKKRPSLSLKSLERESNLPYKTLGHFLAKRRMLNQNHLNSLIPTLKKYGLKSKDLDY